VRDGHFYPTFDWSYDGNSRLLDTNWPDRWFLSQVEIRVLRYVAFHLVPPALMLCFFDNLDDCEEKRQSFGSFGEGVLCVVLRAVVGNGQKRAVDFLGAPSNLIKMHLSLICHELLFL